MVCKLNEMEYKLEFLKILSFHICNDIIFLTCWTSFPPKRVCL